MGNIFTSFLRSVGRRGQTNPDGFNPLPMLNEVNATLRDFFNSRNQTGKKKVLMRWYKNTLELQTLVNKVARDIVGKGHFENVDPKVSGRNKILRANRFAAEVQYRRWKLSQVVDKLVTGESYAWLGFLKDDQLKDAITKAIGHRPFMESKELKDMASEVYKEVKQTEGIADVEGIDEDMMRPRKYMTIASTTMEVLFDRTEIKGYHQVVAGERKHFGLKEIIRSTFMDIDGKVNGYTSVESALVQLELLRFMWGNMMSIHKNGGAMDKLFVLEDTQVNSEAYKRMRDQLKKYKLVENKHGNMLFTGKVKIEELQQLDKMQFMDMGLYITGLMGMIWEVPKSSMSMIVGGANTKDDTGGNSEKGYWEGVEYNQESDAAIDNLQLWIPHFGVIWVYDKKYVQKDVQEETAKGLKLQNVKTIEELAAINKKRIRFDEKTKMLHLDKEIFEDIPEEDLMIVQSGNGIVGTGRQMSNDDVNNSQDKTNANRKKKQEADQAVVSGGMRPTGTGKEWDSKAELEYKQMIGSDAEILDLKTFTKIYNQDRASHPGMPPRVFLRENDNFITLKFKSTDFVYKTIIDKDLEEDNRVLFMNFGDNVFRL